nr:MAG: nonstructural protein [Microviridae sp.]
MLIKLFSVYDSALKAFMLPQYYQTSGVAERAFKKGVNTPDQFEPAADFTMFELGEFDDETGSVSMHEAPIRVVSALQVKDSTGGSQSVVS